MITAIFLIIGMLMVSFQTTILQFFPSWLGSPDLVFVLVAFIAYRFDWLRGGFLAITLGWMMDVTSGIYLGAYLLEYLLVFVGLRTITANSPLRESAYQVPMVGLSYFIAQFLLYCVLSMTVGDSLAPWSWSEILRKTIILTVATIPCFLLFNSLFEYLQKRKAAARVAHRKGSNRFRQ